MACNSDPYPTRKPSVRQHAIVWINQAKENGPLGDTRRNLKDIDEAVRGPARNTPDPSHVPDGQSLAS